MKDIIIIPTYNEKKNIEKLISAIFSILPSIHILVVDDNSPDGTAQEVEEMKKEFPKLDLLLRPKKEGLGKAYIHAIRETLKQKDIRSITTMDADFSHNPSHLLQMLNLIDNYDVVIGSRYVKGGRIEGWELWRKILSRFGNFYFRLITRLPIFDCSGGFNTYRIDTLRKINLEEIISSGYVFLVELKYYLWKVGARLKETPIVFKSRQEGESKINMNIILEGVFTPLELIFKNTNELSNLFRH